MEEGQYRVCLPSTRHFNVSSRIHVTIDTNDNDLEIYGLSNLDTTRRQFTETHLMNIGSK